MVQINHVVFDIGKVLIHYDPERPFLRLIPDPQERRDFLQTVCTNDWNLEQDRGRPWPEAEALLIVRFPQQEANIRAFRRHWPEMVYGALEDSVTILRALIAGGRDVTMLTNFASDTFLIAQDMYSFLHEPRGVTVSGKVGLIKPDPAIYHLHTDTFGLDPAATLFIDDNAANISAAQAFGWQAVLFTDPAQLRRDLAAHGVNV